MSASSSRPGEPSVPPRRVSRAELAACHGRSGGKPVLIAYRGQVYDVTESYPWRLGFHWACAYGGEDVTGKLAGAPHCEELLARVPCIGALED
jgi:predicted heme/steroid binding protein